MASHCLAIMNIGKLCTMEARPGDDLGILENAAVICRGGCIDWVGPSRDVKDRLKGDERIIDAQARLVTPGLIDPHTHLVFAGSRHREFEMRLQGRTYLEILKAGGGILSTVAAVRQASEEDLYRLARMRADRMLSMGTTVVEAKSGYGLSLEDEIKILRVVKRLADDGRPRIVPTFLGAHAVPAEYREKRERYVDLVVEEMLPAVAGEKLAQACDVYLEDGAFSLGETRRILGKASDLGLKSKMHAGQFNDLKGAELAAELGCLSVDHIEKVSPQGIEAMARAGVSAVLLPGAAFSLGQAFHDGSRFAEAGVNVAVATDLNPGTSNTENLLLCAAMAAVHMKLGCAGALRAVTIGAARALGIHAEHGSVAPGKRADFVIFGVDDYRSLFYHFGVSQAWKIVVEGDVAAECEQGAGA